MGDCYITRKTQPYVMLSTDGKFQYPSKVIVPNTVTSLQANSLLGFYTHNEIEEIIFESGSQIKTIGISSFHNCTNLKSINIPESITSIGSSAFNSDISLQSVSFDETENSEAKTITFNGSTIFDNCSSLTTFKFKDNSKIKLVFTTSSAQTFRNCKKIDDTFFSDLMSRIDHPKTYVGAYIFQGCTNLKKIICPIIGNYLFQDCSVTDENGVPAEGLEEATIEPLYQINSASIQGVFQNCKSLKKAIIKNITAIGTYFFQNCINLVSVTLPENVTAIYTSAFSGCSSLSELFLPSTITYFGGSTVFAGCTNLTNLSVGTDWNCTADFSQLTLSESSLKGVFENLKDLTGTTGKSLTISLSNYLTAINLGYITQEASGNIYKGWTIKSTS